MRPLALGRTLLAKTRIDGFILAILCTVGIATLLPASGHAAEGFSIATSIAVGLLFFLYGARLSTKEAIRGLTHWRLHLMVLAATYVLFPLLGLASIGLVPWGLSKELYLGVLFLCVLPSTVQSSIAFTTLAKGNVSAAVCGASVSNMLGVLISPLLIGLLISGDMAAFNLSSILDIALQLVAPFILGQLLRRWIGSWISAHAASLKLVDRGSILLVVYTAFSEGVTQGVWHRLSAGRFFVLIGVCLVLLALMLGLTTLFGRILRFDRGDRITALFCGSKKSLASGLPMATVLFSGQQVGLIVLPLMLFHQIQLMTCAWLASRFARKAAAEQAEPQPVGAG